MMIINFINNTEENSTLPIRLLFVALLSFVLSAPAYAGGSHIKSLLKKCILKSIRVTLKGMIKMKVL